MPLSTEEWHGITSRLKEVLAHLRDQNRCASYIGILLYQKGLQNDGPELIDIWR